jgi:histidinol-phosphate/aromatic aminotransferase/cobyric acid decarboxylase-like protein
LPDKTLQALRDAIRSWVRSLPAVHAALSALREPNDHQVAELVRAAHGELQTIIRTLSSHRASFKDRQNYPSALEHAARGIAGWYP